MSFQLLDFSAFLSIVTLFMAARAFWLVRNPAEIPQDVADRWREADLLRWNRKP